MHRKELLSHNSNRIATIGAVPDGLKDLYNADPNEKFYDMLPPDHINEPLAVLKYQGDLNQNVAKNDNYNQNLHDLVRYLQQAEKNIDYEKTKAKIDNAINTKQTFNDIFGLVLDNQKENKWKTTFKKYIVYN